MDWLGILLTPLLLAGAALLVFRHAVAFVIAYTVVVDFAGPWNQEWAVIAGVVVQSVVSTIMEIRAADRGMRIGSEGDYVRHHS